MSYGVDRGNAQQHKRKASAPGQSNALGVAQQRWRGRHWTMASVGD